MNGLMKKAEKKIQIAKNWWDGQSLNFRFYCRFWTVIFLLIRFCGPWGLIISWFLGPFVFFAWFSGRDL